MRSLLGYRYSNKLYYMFNAAKKRDNYKMIELMKTIKKLPF